VNALEVQGIVKAYGGLLAVRDMHFDLAEGEVLGLLGPNGSGKTTMINLISGSQRATSGAIRLFGEDITRRPANRISKLGVARTFQLVRMLESMSVIENVEAGGVFGHARRWGRDLREYALAMLDKVGLAGKEALPVGALTYIDQKRVELARVLVGDPKVLLLDEWLAGLNPTELLTGIALIDTLRAEGRTILIVEHVMDAIRSLCDRCVVMNSGIRIAEGRPEAVLAEPEVIEAYLGSEHA